jgi:hypothetical protein
MGSRLASSKAMPSHLLAGFLLACPDCVAGRAARAQVWADDLALNLAALLAPVGLVILASVWADRAGRASRS